MSGTGKARIDKLGDTDFRGKVGKNVAAYSKDSQRLAHDFAAELDDAAERARRNMLKLRNHPMLSPGGVAVRVRARRVTRQFRKAKEAALAVSAEMVKFNAQYRREFIETDADRKDKKRWSGEVDL
ncbi:hypothetical protein [Actinomadura sp. GTD37]|uniref:hypothetical protein n=1 Tax=Actinomadura sp. GTD37 TaxID=1778030 RepID=UPI0035C1FFE3